MRRKAPHDMASAATRCHQLFAALSAMAAVLYRHSCRAEVMSSQSAHSLSVTANVLLRVAVAWFGLVSCCAQNAAWGETLALRLDGDVGIGVYYTPSIIRERKASPLVLPYGYFDYGRVFARIDTFGIKTFRMGYGHLELAGRVRLDGFKPDEPGLQGLQTRKMSLPLGIGSLQQTPVGSVFIYALHDVSQSSGNVFDVTYVAKMEALGFTIYPQVGAEYLSKRYVAYHYGVSEQEAAASRFSRYQPGGAFNPFVAAMLQRRLADHWYLNLFARHKWLAAAIHDSPVVDRKGMDTVFLSLAYRFQ